MGWQERLDSLLQENPKIGRRNAHKKLMSEGFDIGEQRVRSYLDSARSFQPPQKTNFNSDIEHEETATIGKVTTRSRDIQSPEQALKAIGINPASVEIVKQRVSTSEVTIGGNNTATGVPETYTNFHVYVEWKKQEWRNALVEFVQELTPVRKKTIRAYPKGEHLLIPSLYDHHFGKLAWNPETGNDYDLKIAEQLYLDALGLMLEKARHYGIEQIQFPLGQDFLHIDNAQNTTANGTPQDVDSRLRKIIKVATGAVVEAVEMCRQIAPTTVLWVPGNHDPMTSYFLALIIEAHYRNIDSVTVDATPTERKYIEYGVNLIGTTHGDEQKEDTLPLTMATQMPDAWARTKHREWHTGHLHKRKEMKFVSADSFGPVLVRRLPSLSGTDKWHYKKGYVGGMRAAEAYLYHKHNGYAGHIPANICEIERVA